MDNAVYNQIKEDEPVNVAPSEVATGGVLITPSGNVLKGASTVTPGKIYQSGFHQLSVAPGESIQDAINALDVIGGGILFLEQGTHIVTSAIAVKSAIQFIGENQTTTIIDFNNTAANFTLTGTDVYATGTITSITSGVNVTGSGTSWLANVTTAHQIFIGNSWYKIAAVTGDTTLVLSEGYQSNATLPGAAYRAAKIISDVEFNELTIKNSTGTAIAMTDVRGIDFERVGFIDNNKGFVATNAYQFNTDGIEVVSSTSNGYELTNARFCNLKSTSASSNGGHGVVLNNFTTGSILESAANSNTSDGFNITSCTDLIIQVQASSNGGQGIECVSGNDNLIITQGLLNNNTEEGIKFTISSDNCKITNCTVKNNTGTGIKISDSTCDNNIIIGNTFVSTNTSVNLNGSTQYASNTSSSALINPTGNFTVEAFFKIDTLTASQVVVTNVVTDSNNYGPIYKITLNTNGSVSGQTWDSGSSFLTITSAISLVTTGVWYRVAFIKSAANNWELLLAELADDYSSVATSSSSRTISGTGKTGIRAGADEGSAGSTTPSGSYFDGLVDEVRFWDTNKTAAQLNALKTPGVLVGNETNLQALFEFSSDYTDETSNAFNLTATGSPTFFGGEISNSGTGTLVRSNIGASDN